MLSEDQRLPNGFTVSRNKFFNICAGISFFTFSFLRQFIVPQTFFDFVFILIAGLGGLTILKFIFGRVYAFFAMLFPKENLADSIPEDQRLPNGFTIFENKVCNVSLVVLLLIAAITQQIVNPQSSSFGLTVMADLGVATIIKFIIGKLRIHSWAGRVFSKKPKEML